MNNGQNSCIKLKLNFEMEFVYSMFANLDIYWSSTKQKFLLTTKVNLGKFLERLRAQKFLFLSYFFFLTLGIKRSKSVTVE